MGEYRRWISYVYSYLNGVKGQSAGHVKIESRNGKCRIYANIKAPYSGVETVDLFVFYRENDKMVLVELGRGNLKKGQCEFTYDSDDNNIGNKNLRLEQLGGLVGIVDDNRFFGTVWDEKEIILSNAILLGDSLKEKEIEEKAETKTDTVVEEEAEIEIEEEAQREETDEIIKGQEVVVQKEVEATDYIERIFARYPGMYPFEDDEIVECVKLEPQDIGILPMEKWILANNSFLLHGYYTYRHLIFAKLRGENVKDNYILGVPGLYRDRERFMAGMFGFDKFKGVRGTERDYGEFGYWYMNLDL